MPITLITGPANAGKAELVMDEARRQLARGEAPLLVVPTRADADHYLWELAGSGLLGARVQRFDGLVEELVRRAGITSPQLRGVARERVIAAILAEDGELPASPQTVRALAELFRELRGRRVGAARLRRALEQWGSADGRAAAKLALGRLYARYDRKLEGMGRLDSEQLAVAALDELRRTPHLWDRSPVLFYGFDDLTPLQLDTVETLGRVLDAPVTVSLAFERGRVAFAGRAATFAALAPLAAEHRELGPRDDYYAPGSRAALGNLERSLFTAGAPRAPAGSAVRLLEGGGERAELELVAHEIAGLLGAGFAPEEIALVLRRPESAAGLLEEVLRAAAVPFAFERRRRFADSSLGRALLGLLRCAGPEGSLGDLLAWLRAPGLLRRPELADRLEFDARRGGVTAADEARALWEERHWRLETIDHLRAAAPRGPVALVDRTVRELHWLFEAPRRGTAGVLDGDEAEDAAALGACSRALAELRELAVSERSLAPGSPLELAAELERLELSSGRRPAPGAVAVLDPLALRARRVRALFLCGLQEGAFPARPRPEAMLAQDERAALGQASGLWLGQESEQLAVERYLLYAAVSRPEELLYLSWHVADDDGEPVARSLFVDDVLDAFENASARPEAARRALGAVGWGDGGHVEPAIAAPGGLSDPEVLAEVAGRPWSASSLECWIGCPVRWFVERLLRPEEVDPQAEPLAKGAFAHAVLRDTLEELRRRTGSARLTPASAELACELLQEAIGLRAPEHPLSAAPERRAPARRRLAADLERYVRCAAAQESPLEPSALELGFGFEDSELPALELGEDVRMRGRIDRIDVGEQGEAVIYDYKARSAPPAARWSADGNLQVALYMRAAERLLGVQAAGGFYQPLSGPDLRARGVLDAGAGLELDCVSADVREHEDVAALVEQAVATALSAAHQARRGQLEPRPKTCAYGGGCLYPSICRRGS